MTIPDSAKSIGFGAFSSRTNLTSVTFANPEGWSAGETELSTADLADPATAAEYLKNTYTYRTLSRKQGKITT